MASGLFQELARACGFHYMHIWFGGLGLHYEPHAYALNRSPFQGWDVGFQNFGGLSFLATSKSDKKCMPVLKCPTECKL